MGELPAGRAGLRQQLRNRCLQQIIGKEKAGLERHAIDATGFWRRDYSFIIERLVKKPADVFLKDTGDHEHQRLGRHTFSVLDHRQVRH